MNSIQDILRRVRVNIYLLRDFRHVVHQILKENSTVIIWSNQ